MAFVKAEKIQAKLRMAIAAPSGAGKTYTALSISQHLSSKRVAVIDTERGSASKYADLFDFDVQELATHHPSNYIKAIAEACESPEHDVLIIDSLSHAWAGKDGILEIVDKATQASKSKNSYIAWSKGTPLHNQLIDAILNADIHVIVTMRTKMAYEIVNKNGKSSPEKVGTKPIQRDDVEYEFDVFSEMDLSNTMHISKTRCPELKDAVIQQPSKELADILLNWLGSGKPDPKTEPISEGQAELLQMQYSSLDVSSSFSLVKLSKNLCSRFTLHFL